MARSQQARSVHEQTRAGRSRTHEGDGQKQSQRRRGDGELVVVLHAVQHHRLLLPSPSAPSTHTYSIVSVVVSSERVSL